MSTVLLETEEEEPFVSLVQYIAKRLDDKENAVQTALADTTGNKLKSKAQELLQVNDLVAVLKLLLPHMELMLEKTEDNSSDSCLIILIQMLVRAADGDNAGAEGLAEEFVSALVSSPSERKQLKLSAMLELFNSWPRSQFQHPLLLRILDFASSAKLSQLAVPLYGRADLWDRQWQLDRKQAMHLFERIAKILDMHPNAQLKKEAFSLQTRVLLACPANDQARAKALAPTARAAALAFIGNPSQFSCDVFDSAPMQALKNDPEQGKVFSLLDTLLHGKISAFNSSDFAGIIEEAQTSEAELLNKMRLMALLAVCSPKEGQEVTFKEVEDALALEAGQAEGWLVQAFGKSLLDGRINQVSECVSVRRCERCVFGAKDWEKLLGDLESWKDGLDGLDVTMKGKNLLTPSVTVHPWLSA